ncbi:hypothetical protein B0H16DRAFT_1498526 [Mycena metata]|uniref:Uncharacterized protein n=1 Tax=Mycena metata TaxID=1033252 RepID=A0AAD7KA91_9AGAR|nr:hypothetical protein B0H16DRAFT_1498526 [Mycena metata]
MLPHPSSAPTTVVSAKKRPRGLWHETSRKELSRPSKRRRYHSESTPSSDDADGYYILEYSPEPSTSLCHPMDANEGPSEAETKVEDWEDLKELFGRAAEQYESDDVNEALPLLRGVIHECHRLMLLYEDPSVLFAVPPTRNKSPEPISISPSSKPRKKCKCKESPTAFHAILGTALFLMGNLIAQDASVAVADEPTTPATYWLAALDVFETGESLPGRTSGRGCEASEDWRMAVVWGRTLVAVADEALTLSQERERSGTAAPPPEPKWPSPAASPFAAIAMRRPPASRRITLANAPHELLLVAMDQFSRGIFHMPHPAQSDVPTDTARPFSRATELFTIAREVLALAERLPDPAERARWATWADSMLQQMDMEGDTNRAEWRGPVTRARGRCWLVVGTAGMEDMEAMAEERGWAEVLDSEEADEAREGLTRAVEFFERATGNAKGEFEMDADDGEEAVELRCDSDEEKREELYRRAQLLGGDELEGMDMDD